MHLFLCVNPSVHDEGTKILTACSDGLDTEYIDNSNSCFKQIFLSRFLTSLASKLAKNAMHFEKSSLKIQYEYQKRRIWCWFRNHCKSCKNVYIKKFWFVFHLFALHAKVLGPLTFSGYDLLQLFPNGNQNQILRFLVPMLFFFGARFD